jgi:hypothetical protein
MPTASSPPTSAPIRADWPFVLVALGFGALIG